MLPRLTRKTTRRSWLIRLPRILVHDTTASGKVALVTGASRGIGRGIALGLGEAGATVYVTGRTLTGRSAHMPFLSGSLEHTAQEVTELGGLGIAVQCDHTDDAQTRAVVDRIRQEHGRLDVLVNNVWGGYEGLHIWDERGEKWNAPFWEQPTSIWDDMFASGVRAHYVTSQCAAPLLIEARGLLVGISFFAATRHQDTEGIPYFLAKTATDRMALAMANHLHPHGVTSVSLYPGLVRTEGILRAPEGRSTCQIPSRPSSSAARLRPWRVTRTCSAGRGRCWWLPNLVTGMALRTPTESGPGLCAQNGRGDGPDHRPGPDTSRPTSTAQRRRPMAGLCRCSHGSSMTRLGRTVHPPSEVHSSRSPGRAQRKRGSRTLPLFVPSLRCG
ncbi:SDR family NAD(P)-dependent oxidoreductase [Deinococcus malanensis]|uniref:SDR family NAD(P)-dependent oxidoreductase n=1 Tax=Deinococcus malanensis TaxID=1706855 RepID=UPI00362E595D